MGFFSAKNRNILIISLIVMVNMLGYGIIIPILYSYSKKYGLSDFQNGLLFAIFSICQFISTPIIGRLSDKYGRRPMLIFSITGTAISFFMMAFAPGAIFLFISRALDGLTAGNIPVAFAVISDSTAPEDRANAFGKIGAAFNFGFVFGPIVAALTLGMGASMPFIIAGLITTIAVTLTALFLPETNKHMGEDQKGKLFDFPMLAKTLFAPGVGATFMISLVFFLAFSCAIIYGFQPYVIRVLGLSTFQNTILFAIFGTTGLICQTFIVQRYSKWLGMRKAFMSAVLLTSLSFFIIPFAHSIEIFALAIIILALFNSVVQTLIPAILSQEADAKSQGSMMGLNSSYQSVGMIFGPILGGFLATFLIPLPFFVGGLLVVLCFFLSFNVLKPKQHPQSAF
ncbi:MAG TPA: MFS transporter [Patescibacteria group bacterium]|nr:MFS transporter [Patescibacteria group bacterium]